MSASTTEVDVLKHILEGITAGKGTPGALVFLEPQDLINLGKILADREAQINDLFSAVVEPVNNFDEGFDKSGFNLADIDLTRDFEQIDLPYVTGSKRIYFLLIQKDLTVEEVKNHLHSMGLTFCKHAANYLLGAMSTLSEKDLPVGIDSIDIVAVNPEEYFEHPNEDEDAVFAVYRVDNERKCELRTVSRFTCYGFEQIVIAEKM